MLSFVNYPQIDKQTNRERERETSRLKNVDQFHDLLQFHLSDLRQCWPHGLHKEPCQVFLEARWSGDDVGFPTQRQAHYDLEHTNVTKTFKIKKNLKTYRTSSLRGEHLYHYATKQQ